MPRNTARANTGPHSRPVILSTTLLCLAIAACGEGGGNANMSMEDPSTTSIPDTIGGAAPTQTPAGGASSGMGPSMPAAVAPAMATQSPTSPQPAPSNPLPQAPSGTAGGMATPPSQPTPEAPASTAGGDPQMPASADDSSPATDNGDVCAGWQAAVADKDEGSWSGDVASCSPGDMTPTARDNALRILNFYRSMADLEPVTMSEEGNRKAQACALLMHANGRISHTPDESWTCYSAEAAMIANTSSLSSGPAVGSVSGYMIDPGNATTLGHRRWILSTWLSEVGFGSTSTFSCQYQPAQWARGGGGGKPWIAWPAPGQIPLAALGSRFYSIDRTGWSIQSDTIDFATAQVKVTSAGNELAVDAKPLLSGYGSRYALSMVPMGWQAEAGKSYTVEITGTAMPITYEVEVVDCN